MPKGIIYCMTTIVPGLIKIGQTGTANFEQRMYNLEHNGYSNVVGLKRHFAIEVEDYEDKEDLIDNIFSKSRVGKTELFSLDINLVVQLLSAMEGTQVYPQNVTKEEVFTQATDKINASCIPDGIYYLKHTPNSGITYSATMKKQNNDLVLLAGSDVNMDRNDIVVQSWKDIRNTENVRDGKLIKDIYCDSVSMAATIVFGRQANGWKAWKTQTGEIIDSFRKKELEEDN